jgi:hypothetical protein
MSPLQQGLTPESNSSSSNTTSKVDTIDIPKNASDEGAAAPTASNNTNTAADLQTPLTPAESRVSSAATTTEGVIITDDIKEQLFLFGDAPVSPHAKSQRTAFRNLLFLTTFLPSLFSFLSHDCERRAHLVIFRKAKNIRTPPLSPSTRYTHKHENPGSFEGLAELPPEWDDPEKVTLDVSFPSVTFFCTSFCTCNNLSQISV